MKQRPILARLYPRLLFLVVLTIVTLVAYAWLSPSDAAKDNAEGPPSERSVPRIPATPRVP